MTSSRCRSTRSRRRRPVARGHPPAGQPGPAAGPGGARSRTPTSRSSAGRRRVRRGGPGRRLRRAARDPRPRRRVPAARGVAARAARPAARRRCRRGHRGLPARRPTFAPPRASRWSTAGRSDRRAARPGRRRGRVLASSLRLIREIDIVGDRPSCRAYRAAELGRQAPAIASGPVRVTVVRRHRLGPIWIAFLRPAGDLSIAQRRRPVTRLEVVSHASPLRRRGLDPDPHTCLACGRRSTRYGAFRRLGASEHDRLLDARTDRPCDPA